MFERRTLSNLDDYFLKCNERSTGGVYFYRINGYNDSVREFLLKYYEAARKTGVILEGRLANPDENNLSYYVEIMGSDFRLSVSFISFGLKKWLPRMNDYQRTNVAEALYDTLEQMRKDGKNENILKNAYIKFMCWLYYKFERIMNLLGGNMLPKILYEGSISGYELKMLNVLSKSGCDIVLLQYNGDSAYRELDKKLEFSDNLELPDMTAFPRDFGIKWLRAEIENRFNTQKLYGAAPAFVNCTNAWISGKGFADILTPAALRGADERFFYNCFMRVQGVEDKITYLNDLYKLYMEIKGSNRGFALAEYGIPAPTNEEIAGIRRHNYDNTNRMLEELSSNIIYAPSNELQKLMKKAFIDVMLEDIKQTDDTINKLTNKAVHLLCWLRRYQGRLFKSWKMPEVAAFIYLGGCRNDSEALFMKMLSLLPVDVLILIPDINDKCRLSADNLYEQRFADYLKVDKLPRENTNMQMGTAAYHAERELDSVMYQDTGMYRNHQYQRAVCVTLRSIYEEIAILWKEEIRFRPNFAITDSIVTVPVIFSKVSGVKDGKVPEYWIEIKKLITNDTFVIKGAPYIRREDENPFKSAAATFLRDKKLQKNAIKAHKNYAYGFLRDEMQEHILDKLQMLLDSNIIDGTYENGTQYTIISTVLNLNRDILRLIQRFDFTKTNPKLIYINTSEAMLSLEDSIMAAFLNLVGFDIVFFVPTGYQCVEKYFEKNIIEEHQIGEYIYDLAIPNFDKVNINSRRSLRDIIFKRGN